MVDKCPKWHVPTYDEIFILQAGHALFHTPSLLHRQGQLVQASSKVAVTPVTAPPPPNPTKNCQFPSLPLFKKSSSQFEDSFTSQRLILRRTQPCGLSIDSHEIHPPRPRPLHPRLLKRQLRHQKGLQLLLLLRKTCRRLLWQRRQVLQDRHSRSLILLYSCDRPSKVHASPRALFLAQHSPPSEHHYSTRIPKLEAPDRLEHWPLKASRSLGGIIEDAAAADPKALSNQASVPLKHLELRNSGLTRATLFGCRFDT